MSREKVLPIVYGIMVFVLSACATAANGGAKEPEVRGIARFEGDPRLGEETKSVCFPSNIDSFSDTTNDTVVLELSPSKSYIVEVTRSCFNLDHAQSIGVDSRGGCLTWGDSLIVSDSAFGLRDSSGASPSRCMIKKIHAWNPKATADEDVSEQSQN